MVASPFRLQRRQFYPWLFAAGVSISGLVFYLLPQEKQTPEILLSLVGSVAAFFHFLYSQHTSNTDRFVALFKEFNSRFDYMNEDLNRISLTCDPEISNPDDIQRLYDYFNLCAEEYLYFKSGYIDHEVWLSWVLGMSHFATNVAIRRLWESELKQGSYYGFDLSILNQK